MNYDRASVKYAVYASEYGESCRCDLFIVDLGYRGNVLEVCTNG